VWHWSRTGHVSTAAVPLMHPESQHLLLISTPNDACCLRRWQCHQQPQHPRRASWRAAHRALRCKW